MLLHTVYVAVTLVLNNAIPAGSIIANGAQGTIGGSFILINTILDAYSQGILLFT